MKTICFRLVTMAATVTATVSPPVQGQTTRPGFTAVTWNRDAESGRIDRGIGIAYLVRAPSWGILDDTALVRARPDSAARVVGAFLFHQRVGGSVYHYGVAAAERLRPNVFEYGYEVMGVAIDSLTARGTWARVILGFDRRDAPYRGWVSLDSTHVSYLLWKKELARRDVYFILDHEPRFFLRPGGSELDLGIRKGQSHVMHPIEARGPWLKVRVAQPADICVLPHEVNSKITDAWIRYLTPEGRPRVWYGTRGC